MLNMFSDIVDPTLQRKYIMEYMDDLPKEDIVSHFRFLEARIAENKLHISKKGTLINLDLIPDSIINILYLRVKISLQ